MLIRCRSINYLMSIIWVAMLIMPIMASGATYSDARDEVEEMSAIPVATSNETGKAGREVAASSSRTDYEGRLIVYVVEESSRWLDNGETLPPNPPKPFGFGVIGYAYNADVYFAEDFNLTFDWDADAAGYDDITEGNTKVVAALFNAASTPAYSDPPYGNYYLAHYVDAAALAGSGSPGSNVSDENYTHTVFLEESAATW